MPLIHIETGTTLSNSPPRGLSFTWVQLVRKRMSSTEDQFTHRAGEAAGHTFHWDALAAHAGVATAANRRRARAAAVRTAGARFLGVNRRHGQGEECKEHGCAHRGVDLVFSEQT